MYPVSIIESSSTPEKRRLALIDGEDSSVDFSPISHECLIPRLADICDEDKDATWITEKENTAMQIATLKTIKYMRKGGLETEKITLRGLEHMKSSETLEQRKINKDAVYGAVLEEQKRQKQLGINDPDEIANASSLCSRWARRNALRLGELDAKSRCKELPLSLCAPAPVRSEQDNCLSILEQALQVTKSGLSGTEEEESASSKRSPKIVPSFCMKANTMALPLEKYSTDMSLKKTFVTRESMFSGGPKLGKGASTWSKSAAGPMSNLRSMMRTRMNLTEENAI